MINGSNIRLPNGQFSTLVTPVNKDGVTQLITPVDANGNVITGGGSSDPSQITSESTPTTRADGSPLQQGDRLHRPDLNMGFFYESSIGKWLSDLQISALNSTPNNNFASVSVTNNDIFKLNLYSGTLFDIYIEKHLTPLSPAAVHDNSNNWNIGLEFVKASGTTELYLKNSFSDLNLIQGGGWQNRIITINTLITMGAETLLVIRYKAIRVGTAGLLQIPTTTLHWRLALV